MAKSILSKSRKPATTPEASSLPGPELLCNLLRGTGKYGARNYWGIPARGGYSGGCIAGSAAAVAYLKYLRVSPHARQFGGNLQNIAMDMLSRRSTDVRQHASESLRGQAVGFFSTINDVLLQCVGMLDALDADSFESIVADIDRGLARTKSDDEALSERVSAAVNALQKRRKRVALTKN